MAAELKKCFFTTKSIAGVWKAEGWISERDKDKNIDQLSDSIARKFKCILHKMDFKDEIKWYMSESSNGGQGAYIFSNENAPELMRKVMDLFEKESGEMTIVERDDLICYLVMLLPTHRKAKEFRQAQKNDKNIEEFNKEDRRNDSPEHRKRIAELVKGYYAGQELIAYEKKIFFRIRNRVMPKMRRELYNFQYHETKEWYKKWNFIMENAGTIRITERYDYSFWIFCEEKVSQQERDKYYKTGELDNEKINLQLEGQDWISEEDLCESMFQLFSSMQAKGHLESGFWEIEEVQEDPEVIGENESTMGGCLIKCLNLVTKILKHKLKGISGRDFDFIIEKAHAELIEISTKVRRKLWLETYREEVYGAKKEDLEKLVQIREMIEIIHEKERQIAFMEYLDSGI